MKRPTPDRFPPPPDDTDRLPGEDDAAWWARLAELCPTCARAEGDRRDPYMLAERIATND